MLSQLSITAPPPLSVNSEVIKSVCRPVEFEALPVLAELNSHKMAKDRPSTVDPFRVKGGISTPVLEQIQSVYSSAWEEAGDDVPYGFEHGPREGIVIKYRRHRHWQITLRDELVQRRHSFDSPQAHIQTFSETEFWKLIRSVDLCKNCNFTIDDTFCKWPGRHFKWKKYTYRPI